MRQIKVVGILGAGLTFFSLIRLQAILSTVRQGDPFVAENASR
jgi:hypothetical protein